MCPPPRFTDAPSSKHKALCQGVLKHLRLLQRGSVWSARKCVIVYRLNGCCWVELISCSEMKTPGTTGSMTPCGDVWPAFYFDVCVWERVQLLRHLRYNLMVCGAFHTNCAHHNAPSHRLLGHHKPVLAMLITLPSFFIACSAQIYFFVFESKLKQGD